MDDLLLPRCPNGRNLEKIDKKKDIYSIRVTLHVRLTFTVSDGVAILRRIGSHDEVYSHP